MALHWFFLPPFVALVGGAAERWLCFFQLGAGLLICKGGRCVGLPSTTTLLNEILSTQERDQKACYACCIAILSSSGPGYSVPGTLFLGTQGCVSNKGSWRIVLRGRWFQVLFTVSFWLIGGTTLSFDAETAAWTVMLMPSTLPPQGLNLSRGGPGCCRAGEERHVWCFPSENDPDVQSEEGV